MIIFNKLNFKNEKIKLSKISIQDIKKISSKFEKYSKILFKENESFSEQNFIVNEIKKSIIKNLISYDEVTVNLSKNIINDFKNYFNKKDLEIEISNPGLMFHLPNDLSEEGTYHYDQIGKNQTYTLWTPISIYAYNPIKYYNFGFHLYKIFQLTKLINLFKEKFLSPIISEIYLWSGYFIHKGNLNTSKSKAAAIAFHLQIVKNNKLNLKSFFFEEINILEIYTKLKLFIDQIIQLDLDLNNKETFLINAEEIIKVNLNFIEKEIVSKIISIIAQRIFTYYSDENNKILSIKLDLIAYYIDKTNYASNQRLKQLDLI